MVNALALAGALLAAEPSPQGYREALSAGRYPWYDARKDELEGVTPPWTSSWLKTLGDLADAFIAWLRKFNFDFGFAGMPWLTLGKLLLYLMAALLVFALIMFLRYVYREWVPAREAHRVSGTVGAALAIGGLPQGLDLAVNDPLAEARRLKDAGDLSAAILYLFVHQLVALDRAGALRLAPGRTARQLVRSIQDPWIRTKVQGTLRLFEASYYGHRPPRHDEFDSVWLDAERVEERLAQGVFA